MACPRRSVLGIAVLGALCAPVGARAEAPVAPPQATFTGILNPVHGHARSGRSYDLSTLRTARGDIRVHASELGIRAGSRVRLSVRRGAQGRWEVTHAKVLRHAPVHRALRGPKLSHGETELRTTAFVLVTFSGKSPAAAMAPGKLRAILADNGDSASTFFAAQSGGRMRLGGIKDASGDVFGPYAVTASGSSCDYERWSSDASVRASERGVDLSAYAHIVFVWPETAACGWAGLAQSPGRIAWLNGTVGALELAHELGHNIGLQHANLLTCVDGDKRRTSISGDCRSIEQRDPFDVMGNGYRGIGAWSRLKLGWIGGQAVQSVVQSGVYRIAKSGVGESSSAGPVGLAVRRCGSGDLYSVEYRSAAAFGSPDAGDAGNVVVRMHPVAKGSWRSQLIDATPQTSSYLDAGLGIGDTIFDANEQIVMTTRALGPDAAEVEITLPAIANRPASVGPVLGGATLTPLGATVQLRWAATKGCGGVHTYSVERNGVRIATTTSPVFEDPQLAHGLRLTYTVTALDAAGNAGPASSVTVATADEEPPDRPGSLEVRALTAGVRLSWTPSSDNLGIVGYSVLRDGDPIGTTSGLAYTDPRTPRAVTKYAVVAVDGAGNRSEATRAHADLRGEAPARGASAPALLKRRPDLRLSGARAITVSMRVASGPASGRCRVEARVGGRWRALSKPVRYSLRRCSVVVTPPGPPSLLRVAVVGAGRSPVAVSRPVRAFLA